MTIDVTEWTKNYITNFVDTYKHCQFVRGQTEMRVQYMLIDPPPTRRELFFFVTSFLQQEDPKVDLGLL